MASGKVKWFNETKGFGFIAPDDGSEQVFVHRLAIQTEGFLVLKENQRVTYDAVRIENPWPCGRRPLVATKLILE